MLAPTPLDVALGTQNLTYLVQNFMEATPRQRHLTSMFEAGRPIQVLPGGAATWDKITGRRHLAGFSGAESPHAQVAKIGQDNKTSALAWIKLYKDIPGHRLFDERAPGMVTPDGQMVIRYELQDLVNMIGDNVERACGLVLSTGKLTASAANFPGTQAIFDLDFGASENLAFTRSAAWATSTTKIVSVDIPTKIKQAFRDGCGAEPGCVCFNGSVEASLLGNAEFTDLVKYAAGATIVRNAGATVGRILSEFRPGSLDWMISTGSFKPEGGAVTPFFPDNTIAVLPAMDQLGDTLGMAYGRGIVPSGPIFTSENAAAAGLRLADAPGIYAYAEIKGEIPAVRVYVGLPFLPVLMDPTKLMRGAA